MTKIGLLVLGAAVLSLAPGVASARYARHRHHAPSVSRHYARYGRIYMPVQRYESAAPYYRNGSETPPVPYVPTDDSPSSIILRRTIQAQGEPGVTSELAPDARQTATGGPVGGVPGFSGGR